MENFDINSLDVKALRLLLAIAETGSVSAAAELRAMTQSTASYQLDRLRQAFGDPLFVRMGRGVTPTDLGSQIIGECRLILERLDQLVSLNRFDAQSARRDFIIAAAAYEVHTILGPVHRLIEKEAPDCRLIIRSLDLSKLASALDREWDMALMATRSDSPLLKQTTLFQDEYVTFYDPARGDPPQELESFCSARHAIATLGGRERTDVDVRLGEMGRDRTIKLVVNQLESLPALMKGSDLISTLPKRMHDGLMRDFAICPCPVPMPPLSFHAVWHARKESHPAHQWLRQLVRRAIKG